MLTLEQIQDYLGPDIQHVPLSLGPGIDDVRFCLVYDAIKDSGQGFSLQIWDNCEAAPALGTFGRLRALRALNLGEAAGPLFFITPFYKCITYVPVTHLEPLREALWEAGAGHVGHYSRCSFAAAGTGTFWPEDGTHPFLGTVGTLNQESEMRLEVVVPRWYQDVVEKAIVAAHPYEEPAYDWIAMENRLGISQAYCDKQGEWWFIEDRAELLESVIKNHPPTVHCEKISWTSRVALARNQISVDIKQPGELLYPGLQKLWGERKKPWE